MGSLKVAAINGGIPSEYTELWTVWAPIVPLIIHINEYRNNDPSDYLIKIMVDTGNGQSKVCFCIIPIKEWSTDTSRSTYAEGGVLAKQSLDSGINKCILCFCVPEIKEINWNLKKKSLNS